nr:MAG TPA: hypothetical protein [Caudoviricetes sp.]
MRRDIIKRGNTLFYLLYIIIIINLEDNQF